MSAFIKTEVAHNGSLLSGGSFARCFFCVLWNCLFFLLGIDRLALSKLKDIQTRMDILGLPELCQTNIINRTW